MCGIMGRMRMRAAPKIGLASYTVKCRSTTWFSNFKLLVKIKSSSFKNKVSFPSAVSRAPQRGGWGAELVRGSAEAASEHYQQRIKQWCDTMRVCVGRHKVHFGTKTFRHCWNVQYSVRHQIQGKTVHGTVLLVQYCKLIAGDNLRQCSFQKWCRIC